MKTGNLYEIFTIINKFGQKSTFSIHWKDVRRFKEDLQEQTMTRDVGDLYQKIDGEWVKLDYYND